MNAIALPSLLSDLPLAISMLLAGDGAAPPWKADVVAARKGDPSAFESLVRSVQRPVYGLALRLLGNESEASEVSQEAFVRAWQNLHRYDDSRPFDLWVMAITRNLCLDLLRRRTRVKTEEIEPMKEVLPSGETSAEDGAIARQERQSLEEALNTLPPEDKEVLALYYVQRRTTKEIAQVLGVAPGTIMARLFRAREKLRRKMSVEEPT